MLAIDSSLKSLSSEMKGFLFFAGSLLRWSVKEPRQFLLLHAYVLLVYTLAFSIESIWGNGLGLTITFGALAPLSFWICKGLPLDCLDYKSAIIREVHEGALND